MNITVLFPCDFFNTHAVDSDFVAEYDAACSVPELRPALYNHDELEKNGVVSITCDLNPGLCVLRGWMIKPQVYLNFYNHLHSAGAELINTPEQYHMMHCFPFVYPYIAESTPKTLVFPKDEPIDVDLINQTFTRFMIKDYVKSVKGSDFPAYFSTPVKRKELLSQLDRFYKLRGDLFTGGTVFKEYVELKRYGAATNEYRAFYINGDIGTVSRNSNQPYTCPFVPRDFVLKFAGLGSRFYTVDFAELEDETFTVLETGDGQVSGLSPWQDVFLFYDGMRRLLCK